MKTVGEPDVGSHNYQYISSLLSTWRLKGLSMFAEMDKILRKELCGFGKLYKYRIDNGFIKNVN